VSVVAGIPVSQYDPQIHAGLCDGTGALFFALGWNWHKLYAVVTAFETAPS